LAGGLIASVVLGQQKSDKDKKPAKEEITQTLAVLPEPPNTVVAETARLASYYNSKWFVLYVQTPGETFEKIPLAAQRHLINNFKDATEFGAEVLRIKSDNVARAIMDIVKEKHITTVCMGKPHLKLFQIILRTNVFNQLLKALSKNDVDLIILS